MTQYAMPTILPNTHNGTDLANFLNASYPALYSYHRGSSRPSYAIPGMIWIDSSVANVDSVVYFDGTHDILIHSFDTTTGAIIGGGPFTPGNMFHQGAIDPTIAAPASPRNGDVYVVSTAGAAHASFTGLAGTTMTVGDVIFYDGANWQALKLQSIVGSYLPLAGGTLSGILNFSGASVSQPFTSVAAANVYGFINPTNSANGGLNFRTLTASAISAQHLAYAGIPNTANNSNGVFVVNAGKHNGSGGVAALAANENAFSVSNNGNVVFLVKGNGDLILSGSVTGANNLVTTDTTQTITGTKTFSSGPIVNTIARTLPNTYSTNAANANYVSHHFRTQSTAGTLDWNDDSNTLPGAGYTLMQGLATNGPGGSPYYHPLNVHFGVGGNLTQFAIGYNAKDLWMRYRYTGAWSSWVRFLTNENSGSIGLVNGTSSVTIPTANSNILFNAGGSEYFRIGGTGTISTGGESAPDVDPGGICIFNGAGDGNAMSFKNSDVAHPFIAQYETDTYGIFQKFSPSAGGFAMLGFSEGSSSALYLAANMQTPGTVLGTNNGAILLNAFKSNGTTGLAALSSTEIAFTIKTGNAFLTQLTGNGSLYQLGSIATGGETAPDADFGGITTYTVGGSGTNLTLKNSSVNHGMTSVAETDTYGALRKSGTTTGGLLIRGLSSGSEGLFLTAQVATPNTSTGYSPVTLHASKANGTGVQAIAASESVLGIYNNSSASIVRVMGNGDVRIAGGLATGGETAPDVDLGGICINTGALDGNAMTFKNSDVAHSFTSFAEADTYGFIKKGSPTAGGLFASGFGTAEFGMYLRAFAPTPTSASSGTGNAVFSIDARTGVDGLALVGDSDNLFAVKNANYIRLLVKGNGDTVVSGGMVLGGASLGGALVDPNALKIRHSGGSNFSLITAVSSSFTNPWTVYPSDQMWALQTTSPANGGMAIIGISTDANIPALGALFVAPGSSNTGAITFNAAKHNGSGGIVDMTGNDIVFRISSGVPLLTLRGDKRMQIGGGLTTGGGNISLLGLDAFGTYIRGESAGNVMALGAGGVNQPFADMLPETTTFFNIPSSGGLKVTASAGSGMSNRPLEIVAIGGGSASVANTAMVNQKHDGSGGVTELGSTDVMFAVLNNTTPAVSVKGNGDTVSAARFCGKVELVVPTAGGSTAANDSTQTLILNHSATIATHTITLPLGRNDGQEFRIASRSAVTTLTLNASGGQTVYGGITSLTASGRATYIYSSSNTSWYRLN